VGHAGTLLGPESDAIADEGGLIGPESTVMGLESDVVSSIGTL
jgi:hypothetical protein